MKTQEKLFYKYFGAYGIGNFDISFDEVVEAIELCRKGDEKIIKEYYERLHNRRMGQNI